ncbi:MAG: tetratricopeptide repeat protein [Planctomycetota bacterium]|jgi:tetratricopeptide (TPR) repeat protein
MFATCDTLKAKVNGLALPALCLVFSYLLFSAGCNQKQQAVDLYVDAVMLRELNQNEVAAEKLNAAIKIDNHFSLAYSLLGEICLEIKNYEKSAAAYEKAAELNPWSFKDYFNLGRVYEMMRKFALAVKAYVKACELKPDHLEAHVGAAKSYYKLKDYNGALVYGRRASQIDPNLSEIQTLLGDVYKSQKEYEQAIRSYKRSLEIDSSDPNVMTALAIAYLHTKRYEPAKELFALVIRMQPYNSTAHQYLGYCHLLLADVDQAIKTYTEAVEINEKDWQARRGLGVAYMQKALGSGDDTLKAKAIQQWRLSLAINPNQDRRDKLIALVQKYSKQKSTGPRNF